jgi:hypothetical protein
LVDLREHLGHEAFVLGRAGLGRHLPDKLKGRFASDHCLTARGTSGQVLAKLPLIVRR